MTKTMAEVIDYSLSMFRTKLELPPEEHRALVAEHVAAALTAAGYGLVADAQARAYDKGYGHGLYDEKHHPQFSLRGTPRPQKSRRNPYRKASNDDQ